MRGHQKVPEEKTSDKVEVLRAENRKLRKEVQQLRKELERIKSREHQVVEIIDEYRASEPAIEAVKLRCSNTKCNSKNITILEKLNGNMDYYICNDCGARGRTK